MMSLKNTSRNWLLFLGIFSLILATLLILIFGKDIYPPSRNLSDLRLEYILVFTVILAPIYEEFIFRGIYTSNKLFKAISLLLLPAFVLFSGNKLAIILLGLFGFIYVLSLKFKNQFISNSAMLLNVLVFAVLHYEMEELGNPAYFYFAFFQFGIGAILLWVIINYGVLKAILSHAAWNLSLMIFMLISLQYPDETLNYFEDENINVEWNRVPKFESDKTLIRKVNEDSLIAENVEARYLYMYLSTAQRTDSINKDYRILQKENYMKYNFKILNKRDTKSIEKFTRDFLTEEGLVLLGRK